MPVPDRRGHQNPGADRYTVAMESPTDVVIIGAGVVGLASAVSLLESGRSVRVLEATRIGAGSSHGNCGTLTPSHASPLAAPGTISKALRWMLTPDAPFYVKPRIDPSLWAWMLRFASRCNRRDWHAAMLAKGRILQASRAAFPDLIARYRLDCAFAEEGFAYVFRDPRKFERYCRDLPALAELGIVSEPMAGTDYLRGEPALREGLVGAVRFPGDARLRPDHYVAELARVVRALGGEIIEQCPVDAITESRERSEVAAGGRRFGARDVVIATGAWSGPLGRALGLRALGRAIQPGKGYSITYSRPQPAPRQPIVLFERSICVTTWESGYRLGSTMEFSGYDTRLTPRRLAALERGAGEYLHVPVGEEKREEWFGWRPLTWDDLPIIGRMPGRDRLWLATGHGMMGVSMSVATARLLEELMSGKTPHLDPAPYAMERFA